MPLPIHLDEVADAIAFQGEESHSYLHRRTGELVTLTDEEIAIIEEERDPEDLPAWQQELLPKGREVLSSEDFLPLPDRWERDDYQIMERFCLSIKGEDRREQLLDAIQGRGAFRRFRATVERLGLLQAWDEYRDEAIREMAAEWLEAQGIPYVKEGGPG